MQTVRNALTRVRSYFGDTEDREYAPEEVRRVRDPDHNLVTIGPYSFTKSVEEDIQVLAANGFNITSQMTGSGAVSDVMFGYFGVEARDVLDTNSQTLRNVSVGTPFAVKSINFDLKDETTIASRTRESFAIEKYVLTRISHPNIVPIRMAVNMGNSMKEEYVENPGYYYQSFERVYIIMDFAEYGSLRTYLLDLREKLHQNYCLKFIKELYSGLKYLHDSRIFHGDVHMGNILVFNDGDRQNPVLTLKLADYGLSYVFDGNHYSSPILTGYRFYSIKISDITGLGESIERILYASACNRNWRKVIQNLVNALKFCEDLNEVIITKKFEFLLGTKN